MMNESLKHVHDYFDNICFKLRTHVPRWMKAKNDQERYIELEFDIQKMYIEKEMCKKLFSIDKNDG